MITLMNLFTYPGKYKCGFAGVPVSDVIMRMGYSTDDYRKIFSDEGHIRKTPREDMAEYKRRSPVWHAEKLQDPLLIHTNTSDDDVNVVEVEHMIRASRPKERSSTTKYSTVLPVPIASTGPTRNKLPRYDSASTSSSPSI